MFSATAHYSLTPSDTIQGPLPVLQQDISTIHRHRFATQRHFSIEKHVWFVSHYALAFAKKIPL